MQSFLCIGEDELLNLN